jgi:cbb3-type cytochrome c oxidase subunit III
MPGIGANEDDARALAAYMTSLKERDVPVAYQSRAARGSGAQLGGEALYGLYCVACHGRDLAGSDVPEIRTPSLSNEDFLSVADDAYLTYIIEHGRSGTEMPAWGSASGGLSTAQIERIVGYIRSFQPDRADAAEVSVRGGDPVMGRSLFRGNCAACHGLEGEGGIGTRLNSADFLGLASDEFLTHTVIEGRPGTGMPAWTNLTSDDVSDVLAYVRTWGNRGADVQAVLDYVESPSSPDARMGARLYRSRCSVCHGVDGAGAIGPSLNHENFLSMASNEYLAHALLEGRPGTAMPAWSDLSVEDAGDLIAHLRSLNDAPYREPPRQVPQGDREHGALLFAQTCAACHGTDAVGGLGPQLRNPVFLAHASDGYLFETISRGRHGTAMRGFLKPGTDRDGRRHGNAGIAELSESQVASIVAWLRSLEHAGPSQAWRAPVLGSASRGKDVYENLGSCAKCHGFEGQGGVGPALGNEHFLDRASEGFLLGTMARGRAGTEMRNFAAGGIADLGAEQMMDVAAYVRTLGSELPEGRAGWRRYDSTADQVAVGEKFFAHYCAACHGVDGTGGYAPELNCPEFLTAASDGLLVATIARGRRGTPMRPFGPGPASLANLSHEEIRAIVAYIRSWENPRAEPTLTIPTTALNHSSPEEAED